MFDLSLAETAIIIVIALIFLGPDEIPQIIKTARKFKNKVSDVKKSVSQTFDEIEQSANLKDEVDNINKQATKIVDLDGNLQETYDLSDITDSSDR